MPGSEWRNFILVIKRVMRTPFALVVLGVGGLFALTLHDIIGLLIFSGGVALTAAYVFAKLQDESFIRTSMRDARECRRKNDLMKRTFRVEELDVDSRVRMKTIVKLQGEIAEDVVNSPVDEVAAGLSDTAEQTEVIVERGLALARNRRDLLRYLGRTDEKAIRLRIESLETRLQSESDPAARSEIEMSLASKRRELADYQAIEHAAARVLDELDSIECAFSGLRAKLVRVKSTDIAEWSAANEELKTELGSLNAAVDNLEQSINEALSIGNTS